MQPLETMTELLLFREMLEVDIAYCENALGEVSRELPMRGRLLVSYYLSLSLFAPFSQATYQWGNNKLDFRVNATILG